MKKIALLIFLLSTCLIELKAQHLYVYSVTGQAEIQEGSAWVPLKRGRALTEDNSVRTLSNSSLSILDRRGENLYSFQNEQGTKVRDIIRSKKKSSHLKEYISYLWLTLNNKIERETESAGVVYKGEDITNEVAVSFRKYPVLTQLTDTLENILTDSIKKGTPVFIRVTNLSDTDLFVSFLDIDSEGNISEIIPIHFLADMAELLVPAFGSVIIRKFPLIISYPLGKDYIVPIAYPKPFILSKVIALLDKEQLIAENSYSIEVVE